VTILSQPSDVNCTLTNGSGIMPESSVSNIVLTCRKPDRRQAGRGERQVVGKVAGK
jgi:hypothetical protein